MTKNKMGVGAVSRRVIEEAARLKVPQIVASRRQVDVGGGYTGLDQRALVELVAELSEGATQVIRDHGGPNQGAEPDDGVRSFFADIDAGFHGLHVDVCKLDTSQQHKALRRLLAIIDCALPVEIGGEHDSIAQNRALIETALDAEANISYGVIGFGSYVHADRQCGRVIAMDTLRSEVTWLANHGIRAKIHNTDWIGKRLDYASFVNIYNVAPELAKVEIDAILTLMPGIDAINFLSHAYESGHWERWFNKNEGTYAERAICAARYVLNDPPIASMLDRLIDTDIDPDQPIGADIDPDRMIRERVRDAIQRG